MSKKLFALICSFAVMASLLVGCGKEQKEPVSTEPPDLTVDSLEPSKDEDKVVTHEQQGEKEFDTPYMSFTYDADTMDVQESGSGMQYMASVVQKNNEMVIPRIDFLVLDTSEVGGDIKKDEFEKLAIDMVQGYYGDDSKIPEVTVTETILDTTDPNHRVCNTIVEVEATDYIPKLFAEVAVDYNQQFGIFRIVMLDSEITGETAAPMMKVFESMKIKTSTNLPTP